MKIVALIPLRGGSVSIPRKNIKLLAWVPLCNYVISASLQSELISETWVSTEDNEIKEIAQKAGANVLDRPAIYATNTASTMSVVEHFMENIDFDILVIIQATSPLTSAQDLDDAISTFLEKDYDSMVTWVLVKRFFWNLDWTPMNYNPHNRPRRQDFEGSIMENWSFYITKKPILTRDNTILWGKIGIYKMPDNHTIELDSPEDREALENILQKN